MPSNGTESKMDGGLNAKIPKLYETDGISFDQKTVHEIYVLEKIQFYWLVVEYDPAEKLAFGYANLNDDLNAEWGYISIAELEENGVCRMERFTPKSFPEAQNEVRQYLGLGRRA